MARQKRGINNWRRPKERVRHDSYLLALSDDPQAQLVRRLKQLRRRKLTKSKHMFEVVASVVLARLSINGFFLLDVETPGQTQSAIGREVLARGSRRDSCIFASSELIGEKCRDARDHWRQVSRASRAVRTPETHLWRKTRKSARLGCVHLFAAHTVHISARLVTEWKKTARRSREEEA